MIIDEVGGWNDETSLVCPGRDAFAGKTGAESPCMFRNEVR